MDEALEWFRFTKMTRWALSTGDASKPCAVSTEGISADAAASELKIALGFIPDRRTFKIDASPSKENADAKKHLFYEGTKTQGQMGMAGPYGAYNPYGQGAFPPPPQPGIFTADQVQKMIDEKVAVMMKDIEISNLKAQLAAMKGESPQTATDAAVATFVGGAKDYLPHILAWMTGHPMPMARISGPQVVTTEEENTKMVAEALDKMGTLCDQQNLSLPELLKKLADAASKNPSQIHLLNNMLSA